MGNVWLPYSCDISKMKLLADEVFLFLLLKECSHAFLLVEGSEGQTKHVSFQLQAGVEVSVKTNVDSLLRDCDAVRGALHEVAGKLLSLIHELILRIDMVYKADTHSFVSGDHDVSAEDELFRDLLVGQAGKSL